MQLTQRLQSIFATRMHSWSLKRNGVQAGPVRLTQRRIYILPTRHGLLFALTLILLLVGSINYGLGLGFVLTFLLVSMGLVSILHTWRNLANLLINKEKIDNVFAGDEAVFTIGVANTGRLPRYAIGLDQQPASAYTNVPPKAYSPLSLRVKSDKRGVLKAPRFNLFSEYPLGLLHAWSYVYLDMQCLVYPRPETPAQPLPYSGNKAGNVNLQAIGNDDFANLRNYRPGDSPRHIAWKAAAREQGLLTKEFSGESGGDVWLDFDAIHHLDMEARLSRLTRWVIDADAAQLRYGLRLPPLTLPLNHGPTHRNRCLEALALYGLDA
jgi:uncharacterized protein (DUF58 family)